MYYTCVATPILLGGKRYPFRSQKDYSCNATV